MQFKPGQTLSEQRERVSRAVEKQSRKIEPSSFLWAAAGATLLSAAAQAFKRRETFFRPRRGHFALFIGQWVPTLLLLGLYRKLQGSERSERVFHGQAE